MYGELPSFLETAAPTARTFPPSWRDAAIRMLYDREAGGVRCQGCGQLHRRPAELRRLQGDHIVAYSRGGLTVWANLQLLCPACNLRKQARPMADIAITAAQPRGRATPAGRSLGDAGET